MKRFVLSGLSVLLAAGAIATAPQTAEAADVESKQAFNIHQLRTHEFDSRNKGFEIKEGFSMQQLRTAALDARNKNFDLKEGFSIQQLRLAELDVRNKAGDSLRTTSLIEQRQLVLDRGGSSK